MLLTPHQATSAPKVSIKGGSEGGLFTLVHTDPDPPGACCQQLKSATPHTSPIQ